MANTRNRYAGKGKNKRSSSNLATGRDYTYDTKYQSSPTQLKNRALRNKARTSMIRKGKARLGDNTDVDHRIPLSRGGTGHASNLRVISRSKNRAMKPKKR